MNIARLHITLDGVEPSVARTLLVPVNLRLDRLHLVIQAAMGWEDAHLYAFLAGNKRWSPPDPGFDNMDLSRFRSGQVLMLSGLSFESHGAFPAQG